jgi:hypothetical protein
VLALFVGLIFDSPLAWAAGKAFPPMRDEDSPRNYIVRQVPGDVEVVYFNDYGQACATRVSELRGRVW